MPGNHGYNHVQEHVIRDQTGGLRGEVERLNGLKFTFVSGEENSESFPIKPLLGSNGTEAVITVSWPVTDDLAKSSHKTTDNKTKNKFKKQFVYLKNYIYRKT